MPKILDIDATELVVPDLGPCELESPLHALARGSQGVAHFVGEDDRLVFELRERHLRSIIETGAQVPFVERAGPRENIFFDPRLTNLAIVTCGGLCPGLNNVIRATTLEAHYRYGIPRIYGIRYGFQGFIPEYGHEPLMLTPRSVADIASQGGTVLASSRGRQDENRIVDWLVKHEVGVLVVIGGDGSQRGGLAIHNAARERGVNLAVVGVPKTIDNDMVFLDKSFGFETAFSQAVKAIDCAHAEAQGAPNGIGLVKLMGRESGFIAAHAALARTDVNFVLVPEIPFDLRGPGGFLEALANRVRLRGHAVVLVAEGAGQEHLDATGGEDPSGNIRLGNIGHHLRDEITAYFRERQTEINLKYMDPSYLIRSVPADPQDALYCSRLGQNAVHAGLAGKSGLVVGRWSYHYVHLPATLVTRQRRSVDPHGDLWQSVIACTGQPSRMTVDRPDE
ncbi:MAG: ATP-dependent 6-phosphofructokinase [Chthoniobacterales bacterium]